MSRLMRSRKCGPHSWHGSLPETVLVGCHTRTSYFHTQSAVLDIVRGCTRKFEHIRGRTWNINCICTMVHSQRPYWGDVRCLTRTSYFRTQSAVLVPRYCQRLYKEVLPCLWDCTWNSNCICTTAHCQRPYWVGVLPYPDVVFLLNRRSWTLSEAVRGRFNMSEAVPMVVIHQQRLDQRKQHFFPKVASFERKITRWNKKYLGDRYGSTYDASVTPTKLSTLTMFSHCDASPTDTHPPFSAIPGQTSTATSKHDVWQG